MGFTRSHASTRLLIMTSLSVLAVLACGPVTGILEGSGEQGAVETSVAATLAFERAVATAAEQTQASHPADTPIPASPTLQSSPTPEVTPTEADVQIRADVNTNCRLGPHPVYSVIGYLTTDQTSTVVGRLQGGGWWYIENTTAGRENCWVWGQTTVVTGDTSDLPYITPPPTPTPQPLPDWSGKWTTWIDGVTYEIYISQSGDQISFPIEDYAAYGTLSDNNQRVSGTLVPTSSGTPTSTSSVPYTFEWRLLENGDQFRGLIDYGSSSEAWCGYRNGMSMPDPCMGP
ncbi:MAG: hypothetical protein PVI81_04940 [Anaerolineales bacterium]|jgi:hypothetical protein